MENTLFLECYICNDIISHGKNLLHYRTSHSKVPMIQILDTFMHRRYDKDCKNMFVGCLSCVSKIENYDMAITTAEAYRNEILSLFQKIEESSGQILMEHITEEIEEEQLIQESEEDGEETDEIEERRAIIVYEGEEIETENVFQADEEYNYPKENVKIEKEPGEAQEYLTGRYATIAATPDIEYYTEMDIKDVMSMQEEQIDECKTLESINVEEEEIEPEDIENSVKHEIIITTRSKKQRTSNPLQCKHCKQLFRSRKEIREHRKEMAECRDEFICDICGASYQTRAALRAHVDLHTGVNPITCSICAKQFTQKGALARHMPLHTGEKPYQCDKCGKQFIHYSSFHMHKMAHDDVRDKACTVCGILFRSNSHLSRHMLVHTGAKPHACPKCGIRFAQRYNMNAHLKSHSGIHRTKKHVCPNCQKTFARVGQLQEHLKQCQPTATPENTPLLLEDG